METQTFFFFLGGGLDAERDPPLRQLYGVRNDTQKCRLLDRAVTQPVRCSKRSNPLATGTRNIQTTQVSFGVGFRPSFHGLGSMQAVVGIVWANCSGCSSARAKTAAWGEGVGKEPLRQRFHSRAL